MQSFWDERYAGEEYVYGISPNGFFRECLSSLAPGRLLLPAEGEGRNAVFAASMGWEAEAFDFSVVARQKAEALARQTGQTIRYVTHDISSFPWPENAYDAVGLFFAHVPEPQRVYLHRQAIRSLKPGGHVMLEAFSPGQMAFSSGGPRNPELLYSPDQLLDDFEGLEILRAEAVETDLQEGRFHTGKAAVVRLFAKK
jgi:SAM-dependent methyltransferase